MESISSFFQTVSTRTQDSLIHLTGVRRATALAYLTNFLSRDWSNENVLEPVLVDAEQYVFSDHRGVEVGFNQVLRDASRKDVMQRGAIVHLMGGADNERFFFQTLISRSYGEGCVDASGKDVSFQTFDYIAFGVVVLSKESGKVILHEERRDKPQ